MDARIRTVAVILVLVATFARFHCAAAAESTPVLTAGQVGAVMALPPPIVLPRTLPAGMSVTRFVAHDFKKSANPDGWGFDLKAASRDGRSVTISEATSGFGDPGPDPNDIHRPFMLSSRLLGNAKFDPAELNGQTCYSAYVAVPHARTPPIGDAPVVFVIACGLDRAGIEALYQSLALVKPQTAYPKL